MTMEHGSDINTEVQALSEILTRLGLELVFDLDDTLWDTKPNFDKHAELFHVAVLERLPHIDVDIYKTRFNEALIAAFQKCGVNPQTLWPKTLAILGGHYNSTYEQVTLFEHLHLFDNIYKEVPALKPGCLQLLDACIENGIEIYGGTHAGAEWTDFKLQETGVGERIKPENLAIIDQDGHKDTIAWLGGFEYLKVLPKNVVLIEDNIQSIIAAMEAGVEHAVWVKVEGAWSPYSKGKLPDGVSEVTELLQIPRVLIKRLS